LTVIVDAPQSPKRSRYSTVIFPLFGHANAVFKVRRGCHRGDSPGGLSKLSSTRPPARGQRAPGLVDVLDAPREAEAPAAVPR